MSKNAEIDNSEEIHVLGTLVATKYETYGQMEKCFFPENLGETIQAWHNVRIPGGTIGMVVGYVGVVHTVFYIVLWGGTVLNGKKLAISSNKISKICEKKLDMP